MPNRQKTRENGYLIDVEEFRDFNELLRVCDERPTNEWAHSDGARSRSDSRWTGGSYEQARDLLKYGWDEKLNEIQSKLERFTKAETGHKRTLKTSPVGFAPHVPNAIKGLPYSMIDQKMETKKTKVIDVAVDLGCSSSVSADEIINRAVEVVSKLSSLEASGFRVKISFLKSFNDEYNDRSYCCKIVLKNEYQPLDIKRMAFPLGHPAMLRRIMFDWYERLPEAEEISGYGHALAYLNKRYKEAVTKTLCNKNQYVIDFNTNLDDLFSKLR